MTYDLTLRPRGDALDEDSFVEYFNDREGWSFDEEDPDLVSYFDQITGVYFSLYRDADDNFLVLSLNFFRCFPFALEADLELTAMIEHFDLAVEDPQAHGIEGDIYNDEQFFRGWQHGNAFAYQTALADIETTPLTYDGDALSDIWRWNYNLAFTAEENGGHYIAPPIGFVEHEGIVHTIFVFEIGQNMLVPRTDIVCLTLGDKDVLVPWRMVEEALALTGDGMIDDPVDYWATLATLTGRPLTKLMREPSLDVTKLTLSDVHAIEDVEPESDAEDAD